MFTGRLRLIFILSILISAASCSQPDTDADLFDMRDLEGVPVLWENGMPYFTRFQATDHDVLDLRGTWKFKPDPGDRGEAERWFDAGHDDSAWHDHPVPGCWNNQREEWLDYIGAGWYRLSFTVPEGFSGRFNRLVLDGVAFHSDVWLNGRHIERHSSSGFSRWSIDVTDELVYGGDNVIVIRADTRRAYDTLPPLIKETRPFGFGAYGGIKRVVEIESGPQATLCKLDVKTDHEGLIRVAGVIYNAGETDETAGVVVRFRDLSGNLLAELYRSEVKVGGGSANLFRFEDRIEGVRPWSPADPSNMFVLEVEVKSTSGTETQSVETGFRKFEFRGSGAYLNGKRIFLRGINRHEDDPVTGAVQTEARIAEDLALLGGMNINFVRTSHYPDDPRWLDACDRAGILILGEIPLYQAGWGVKSLRAAEKNRLYLNAARVLAEMIERDSNHPSVIIWSIADETWTFFPGIRRLHKRLKRVAKLFDPERPVTFALVMVPYFNISPLFDMTGSLADVIAVNQYFGWYFGESEEVGDLLDRAHKKWPDKPVLVTELGAGAVIGLEPGRSFPVGYGTTRDFTEQYQAKHLKTQFEIILEKPYVVGVAPWVFADFRDDKRPNNPVPNMNLKGIVNYRREKKASFEVVAETYAILKEEYGP